MKRKNSVWYVGAELWAWSRGRRRRVLVGGNSMLPTLEPGWFVLFDSKSEPKSGHVVVAGHPDQSDLLIVKRLLVEFDGSISLRSDNSAEGSDFLAVDPAIIQGRVTLVLDKPRLRV